MKQEWLLLDMHLHSEYSKINKSSESKRIKSTLENNITTGIVVGRLQKDGKIGWNEFSNLITRF